MTYRSIRRMTTSDADAIRRLSTMAESTLLSELATTDDYCWVGAVEPGRGVVALHRGMRWGDHLLLKGVLVDEAARGGATALELAFALRDLARESGFVGVAAWVETGRREAALARLLRLRSAGPHLHRYEMEIGPPVSAPQPRRTSGTLEGTAADASPMVHDLVGCAAPARLGDVAWIADQHRMVLSGFPGRSVTDHPAVLRAAAAQGRPAHVSAVEFPLPAADLAASLTMAGAKARRLSRTPVRVGRLDFARAHARGRDR